MRLAILTGSSRGLGKATASRLAVSGWKVLGLSRQPSADGLIEQLPVDLSVPGAGGLAVRDWWNSLARPESVQDITLVLNASVFAPVGLIPTLGRAEVQASLEVNLLSALELVQAGIGLAQDQRLPLRVLFVSSPAASIGVPGASTYCIAKAGLEALMRTLHAESGFLSVPVRCASFMPGRIDTDMQAEMRAYPESRFPVVGRYIEFQKRGELRSAESVAEILFRLLESDFESGRAYSIADFAP